MAKCFVVEGANWGDKDFFWGGCKYHCGAAAVGKQVVVFWEPVIDIMYIDSICV